MAQPPRNKTTPVPASIATTNPPAGSQHLISGVAVPVSPGVATPAGSTAAPHVGGASQSSKRILEHDLIRQINLLRDALQSDKAKIGCFIGAGCPLGIYDVNGQKSLRLIPDVAGLTAHLRTILENNDKSISLVKDKFIPCWDALMAACIQGGVVAVNIEHLLTELRTLTALKGTGLWQGFAKDHLSKLDENLCDFIGDAVGKSLPSHRCSYHRLASWIGGIPRPLPVDIFTPNYDLLTEEAFEQLRIPHFDGFVGSREPFFDVASIEQDAIPLRWARLWKLHGSINWQRQSDGRVFRAQGRAAKGKVMIYPSHLKYDQSRKMPYLAMIDRLRAFFHPGARVHGSPRVVLIICGYSFSDEHLNEVLLDGLRGNSGAHCFVLAYGRLADCQNMVGFARSQPNLTILAYDGAIVGTREGKYSNLAHPLSSQEAWIGQETSAAGSTPVPDDVKCKLGDFHYFGLFLEHLHGGKGESIHV